MAYEPEVEWSSTPRKVGYRDPETGERIPLDEEAMTDDGEIEQIDFDIPQEEIPQPEEEPKRGVAERVSGFFGDTYTKFKDWRSSREAQKREKQQERVSRTREETQRKREEAAFSSAERREQLEQKRMEAELAKQDYMDKIEMAELKKEYEQYSPSTGAKIKRVGSSVWKGIQGLQKYQSDQAGKPAPQASFRGLAAGYQSSAVPLRNMLFGIKGQEQPRMLDEQEDQTETRKGIPLVPMATRSYQVPQQPQAQYGGVRPMPTPVIEQRMRSPPQPAQQDIQPLPQPQEQQIQPQYEQPQQESGVSKMVALGQSLQKGGIGSGGSGLMRQQQPSGMGMMSQSQQPSGISKMMAYGQSMQRGGIGSGMGMNNQSGGFTSGQGLGQQPTAPMGMMGQQPTGTSKMIALGQSMQQGGLAKFSGWGGGALGSVLRGGQAQRPSIMGQSMSGGMGGFSGGFGGFSRFRQPAPTQYTPPATGKHKKKKR